MNNTDYKLYWKDSYLRSVLCTVTQVNHNGRNIEVLTDRTIFYPESGGQPGDRGTLGTYQVTDTRKSDDGQSVLILGNLSPEDLGPQVGEKYEMTLDWEHRYRYMLMHSAQHMLSGLLFTMFSIGTVAVHQGEEYLTIETDRSTISQDITDALVIAANGKIRENHRIVCLNMSHADAQSLGLRRSIKVEGDVRIVEIEDVDRIACGGVHVSGTGEIGLVCLIGQEQIRGNVRLYFKCADDALSELLQNGRIVRSLSRSLSCREDELEDKVSALLSSVSKAQSEAASAETRLAVLEIKSCCEGTLCIRECPEGTDLQNYARAVTYFDDLAMFATCSDASRTKWLVSLKGKYEKIDFNGLIRPILSEINAKGGGKSPVFQGIADCADAEKIRAAAMRFAETVKSASV